MFFGFVKKSGIWLKKMYSYICTQMVVGNKQLLRPSKFTGKETEYLLKTLTGRLTADRETVLPRGIIAVCNPSTVLLLGGVPWDRRTSTPYR